VSTIPIFGLMKVVHGSVSQISNSFLAMPSLRSLRSGAHHCLSPRRIWFLVPKALVASLYGTILGSPTGVLRSARSSR